MLKLIETDSAFFNGEPNVNIIDTSCVDGLVKAAADSHITDFVSTLTPEEGRIYVHILAMGAGEYFGANRNQDYFPEANLIQYQDTFMTSPAHVFKLHVNKDPAKSIGQVVFSTYNPRMHRVELIAWIDKEKGKDYIERIERGEYPSTSMACRTPYDVCAVCGNVARTRQEYCEHLSMELGRLHANGKKSMAINSGPLKFFDISMVIRPADVTSSVLQKVAFSGEHYIGSAEAAEEAGLEEKQASFKKLSEFIKNLEGEVADSDAHLESLLARVQDPDRSVIEALAKFELSQILDTMAHLGMSPSLGFLADLIGHRMAGSAGIGIGQLVEGYLKEHGPAELAINDSEYATGGLDRRVADVLSPFVKSASLYPDFILQRAMEPSMNRQGGPTVYGSTLMVPGTNVGYIGNGPSIEPTPKDIYKSLIEQDKARAANEPSIMSMIKTLITVGSAALAAKWYINRMISKRIEEMKANIHDTDGRGVKIVLVKSASDATMALKLANVSLAKSLTRGE